MVIAYGAGIAPGSHAEPGGAGSPDRNRAGLGNLSDLPSYDPLDLWPDGYGWEPLEPWWDRGYHEWYRSLWRAQSPVPAKSNKRRFR